MASNGYSDAGKQLVLGTALWGWTVDKVEAFKMLDSFSKKHSIVDTAINYPIDGDPEHCGLALKWIAEWSRNNAGAIKTIVKIGARDNLGGNRVDLSQPNIRTCLQFLRELLENSLNTISIHWDNRGDLPGDAEAIADTVEEFERIFRSGISIGLSGVRRPDLYFMLRRIYLVTGKFR